MRRREFVAELTGAVAWSLTEAERVRRLGVLTYGSDTGIPSIKNLLPDDLERFGWSEGRNLRLDFRFGDGDQPKTGVFATDLVQLAPDVSSLRILWRSAPCNR